MTTTRQKTWNALWVPGWYELDQALAVGEERRFWFYQQPPSDLPKVESCDFVFFNQLNAAANCQVRTARVTGIRHPILGELERVDTDGLDYHFQPVGGEAIRVNAEEDPGSVFDAPGDMPSIDDWSVAVELADVSQPITLGANS